MDKYVTASFSGGKDSTAMVLHMIDLGEQLDEVITCDTGMEFPEMYDHIARVRKVIEGAGIKFTVLRAEHSFEWYMFEKPVESKEWGPHYGFGWPSMKIRWCTQHLKERIISDYLRQLRQEHKVIQCIGLAADETERLARPYNQRANHRHPLAEWGWTEADAMAYCKARGYDWGGLYDIFPRVSCWICPLKSIGELKMLRRHRPELWARIKEMDARLRAPGTNHSIQQFNSHYTIAELEARFDREDRAAEEQTSLDRWLI